VSNPFYEDRKKLSWTKRLSLIVLVFCIQLIYIPTSMRTAGGIEPKLPFENWPVWPVWILPYVSCYFFWLSSAIWAILNLDDRLFRALVAAALFVFTVANAIFIFFPTYVSQVTLAGNDPFTVLLRFIHDAGGRYSAFPSGHIYITTLMLLFLDRFYPRYKVLWIAILILVSLSTLFTGQHYLLDLLGGFLLASAGYRFGLWWAGLVASADRSGKAPVSSLQP
jgi:membrane-associated phospholipid phosphatase